MIAFKNIKASVKLAAATVATSCLALGITAWVALGASRGALLADREESLAALVATRKTQIESYFTQIHDQIRTFGLRVDIADATLSFAESFAALPDEADALGLDVDRMHRSVLGYYEREFRPRLTDAGLAYRGSGEYVPDSASGLIGQAMYIAQNPNAVGSKLRLDRDARNLSYNAVHELYHPSIRAYLDAFGYYDIFLFDTEGNLVYSVFKETDYATNFLDGPYASTNFAEAYRAGLTLGPGEVVLKDFMPYEASYGAAASFTATPIFREGVRVGVAVFQMPIDNINAIMTAADGLGTTGRTYMIGRDGLMRSQDRFDEANSILATQVGSVPAASSVERAGTWRGTTPEGREILAAYRPLAIGGVDWGIVGEIALSEVVAPIAAATNRIVFVAIGVAALSIIPGLLLGRILTAPIRSVARAAEGLASGTFTGRLPDDRGDEFGTLAKAVNSMLDIIARMASDVRASAESVALSTDRLSDETQHSATAMSRQMEELTQVSAAVEEVAASIQSVSDQCQSAAASTRESGEQAKQGGEIIMATVKEIREIAESASEQGPAAAHVAQSMQSIERFMGETTRSGRQVATITQTVSSEVDRLRTLASGFTLDVRPEPKAEGRV